MDNGGHTTLRQIVSGRTPRSRPLMSENRPRGRAGIACLQCRKQKIRCNGNQPCERCKRMSVQCLFGPTTSSSTSTSPRYRKSSTATKTPEGRRNEESRPPTVDDLPRYRSGSTSPERLRSTSYAVPTHTDHVSPPFSTFTYQPAPDPPIQDLLVPLCAQPFPELQDPIECGIVPLTFARWLFDL